MVAVVKAIDDMVWLTCLSPSESPTMQVMNFSDVVEGRSEVMLWEVDENGYPVGEPLASFYTTHMPTSDDRFSVVPDHGGGGSAKYAIFHNEEKIGKWLVATSRPLRAMNISFMLTDPELLELREQSA